MKEVLEYVTIFRRPLYMRGGAIAPGFDTSHDQFLFGDHGDTSYRFQYDCQQFREQEGAEYNILADGADAAMLRLFLAVKELVLTTNSSEARSTFHPKLANDAIVVIAALRTSTHLFYDDAKTLLRRYSTAQYILLAVLVCFLVILLLGVFRPMIHSILTEQEGANLLLHMIPKAVCDDVPAIAEYLRTGVVVVSESARQIDQLFANSQPQRSLSQTMQGSSCKFPVPQRCYLGTIRTS